MSSTADEASHDEPLTLSEPSSTDISDPRPTENDNDDLSDSQLDRENRFAGPASTWRDYTAEERGLAASLDQQRANDLAVHLYNTHKLKARLRTPGTVNQTQSWLSKQRWIARGEDGQLPWLPDRNWTAWPLPVDRVPLPHEVFGAILSPERGGNIDGSQSWRPAADLQDEILALILRRAKTQFHQRQWSIQPTAISRVLEEVGLAKSELKSSRQETSQSATESPPARPPTDAAPLPVLLADDEEAREILTPTIGEIMHKFDDLLVGLHKSRGGHQTRKRTKKPRNLSEEPKADAAKHHNSQRTHDAEVDGSSSESGDASAASHNSEIVQASTNDQKRRSGTNRHELGLRDWSEVLGVAALVNWDPAVIDRAARRCSSLFGESMAFRMMTETSNGSLERVVEYKSSDPRPELGSEDEEDAASTEDLGFFCPFDNCNTRPFRRAWRWREHLRRKHKLSAEQVSQIEHGLSEGAGTEDSSGDGPEVESNSAKGDE